jgi:hypothetical protein
MIHDTPAWLDELGVTYTLHDALDLDLVDVDASLRNQARFDPLDTDTVETYAASMTAGDQFPPIIVHHAKSSKAKQPLVILSGNHRYHAARKADVKLPAYVVDKVDDPTVLLRIAYQDNATHGLALSRAERVRHAIHLMDNGFIQRDAARLVGLNESVVSDARRMRDAQERAIDAGIAGYDTLPEGVQLKLCRIDWDGPFQAAARLAVRARLTTPQADELGKAVKAARSEAAALEAVEQLEAVHRERIQAQAGGMRKRTISGRTALLSACTSVQNLHQPDVVRSVIDDQDAAILRRSCTKAIEKLQSLSAAIGDR